MRGERVMIAPADAADWTSPYEAIEALRNRVHWLDERIPKLGHHSFEEERRRLEAAIEAFYQLLDACRALDAASSPTYDGDEDCDARFIPRTAWLEWRRRVGLVRKRQPKAVPRDPAHPLFKEQA